MTAEEQEKLQAAIHWMDTMKERLDHYEVHRNEFLSDMRLPPRNVKFLREVLLPFCENTLLLDNIAKSEGLCYELGGAKNRLRIIVRVEHGGKLEEVKTTYLEELVDINGVNNINYPDKFPYLLKHKDYKPGQGKAKEVNTLTEALNGRTPSQKDFEICLPHEHTIYSILENVIRNSAKHNAGKFKPLSSASAQGQQNGEGSEDKTLLKTLDIHVDITEADADHYHCTIYDNVSEVRVGTAVNGAKTGANLADIIKGKNKPLLVDGSPNRANMGMADMKINAFLLKSARDFTENDLNEALDVVVCDRCTDGGHAHTVVRLEGTKPEKYAWTDGEDVADGLLDDGAYLFGYRFKLTKAKKVAWIGKAAEEIAKDDKYRRVGIYGYPTWAKYADSLKETLAAYEIAVLEDEVWKKIQGEDGSKLRENLAQLPFRVLLNDTSSCSVPSPFDRRVIVGSLNAAPKDDLLFAALSAWIKGKYKKPLLVRGYLSDTKKEEPSKWIYTDTEPVLDFELHFKAPHTKADICAGHNVLLSIDHHGELTQAFSFPQVGAIDGHDYFKFANCLDRAYTFSGKANPDHDRMVSILQRSEQNSDELMSMVDRFHRRIVIVDERVAEMVAGKDNPHNDLKVIPADLWAAHAAMNIYVVTELSICSERSFRYEPNDKTALLLELNGTGSPKFNWVSNDKNIPTGVELTSLPPILEKADVLIIHRTHWLKLKDRKLETGMRDLFGEVVITSGAGKPEGLEDLKYLSFATLMNSVRASGASKLGLAQVVDGLTTKPPKK